jgi:hypothetical protein
MRSSYLCSPESVPKFKNPALVLAHPGHELKVFGWMSEHAPRVYILTDGSGGRESRLSSSEKVLLSARAVPGEIFGRLSDADSYRAILDRKLSIFLTLLDDLSESFIQHEVDFVAGDATEGFNPSHDLCRALANAAVTMAERKTGKIIANYEFCLTEWEQHCREVHDGRCLHLRLEQPLLAEKLNAAADYGELRIEVQDAIAAKGEEYFRIECMRKVIEPFPALDPLSVPYYESFGEQRVKQGKYASVIRYRQHMIPILTAIREHAGNWIQSRRTPSLMAKAAAHGHHGSVQANSLRNTTRT